LKENGKAIDLKALKDALSLKGYSRGINIGGTTFVRLEPAWVRKFGGQLDGSTLFEITFGDGVATIRCLTKEEADELVKSSPTLYIKKPSQEAKAVPSPVEPKAEAKEEEITDPSIPTGVVQCDGTLPSGELRLGERMCPYSEGGKTCGRAVYARTVCKFGEAEWCKLAGKQLPGTMAEIKPKLKEEESDATQ
jgi:hypothetical protein